MTGYPYDRLEAALERSTKFIIAERDAFYDGAAVHGTGEVPDADDRAALAEYDEIIDHNRAVLAQVNEYVDRQIKDEYP